MKRLIFLFLICALFSACSTPAKPKTTDEIIKQFKDHKIPLGKIETYTDKTDTNHLLGRPGQYIAKANWEDTRVQQIENDVLGGTIEIFNSPEDLKKRKAYLDAITSSASMFAEYSFAKGVYLLRLKKDLTPAQAKEYEKVLNDMAK